MPINEINSGPNKGLPELDEQAPATSFFEFWPVWLMYIPVVFYAVFLAIRYRGVSLPLLANPHVFLAGMIGESKSDLLLSAGDYAQGYILPFVNLNTTSSPSNDVATALTLIRNAGLAFPLVAKPDLGCRGAGVQVVDNEKALLAYLGVFPVSHKLVLQQLSQYQAEAGVFYVRRPFEQHGKVVSLTLKYRAVVIGTGQDTLAELVAKDHRAAKLSSLYQRRLKDQWDSVPALNEPVSLVFAGSHCRGSIFKNGGRFISPSLSQSIDRIMQDFPSFHYGRLDIKFDSMESFMDGHNFEIIEVNGASSEQTHIWDSQTSLCSALKALMWQYKTLYQIGAEHRQQGLTPPAARLLFKTLFKELKRKDAYPPTH